MSNYFLFRVQEHGGETIIPFSCAFEQKLVDMPADEAAKYCAENQTIRQVNLHQLLFACCLTFSFYLIGTNALTTVNSLIPKIIKTGFSAIHLIYFFTAGPDEVHLCVYIVLARPCVDPL
jgi:obg-like ATPase 1